VSTIHRSRARAGSVVGALVARSLVWSRDERGDVPGWVLVTAMTVALVMMIWGVASSALHDILSRFLDGLRFGS
jgi:DMSO reductase anchor subunit